MRTFIPVDIPEGFDGPVEAPQTGDYVLSDSGSWKRVDSTPGPHTTGFFIRRKPAPAGGPDAVKFRLQVLYARINADRALGMLPPALAGYYLQDISYLNHLLEL